MTSDITSLQHPRPKLPLTLGLGRTRTFIEQEGAKLNPALATESRFDSKARVFVKRDPER